MKRKFTAEHLRQLPESWKEKAMNEAHCAVLNDMEGDTLRILFDAIIKTAQEYADQCEAYTLVPGEELT